ncbi:peroxisomal biogenesis factor 5 [Rhodotorula toruloides]|uniref:Peroxisomal biogenesis factor 5 n=1 Tax=Rhodotorula toruloides TaxID=5286 RepID=A0A511KBK6_RHOTO|nr:peroxisomal biogenesis factor 5 [Rhodotorula toruloides]
MLASLAGGASCGPSNPLQQLSKTYGADRGAQQDHFGSQAGPSGSQTFRQSTPTQAHPSDPSAAQFFQPHPSQPFDLTPLHRALTPKTAKLVSPAPPAWAQAFVAQQGPPVANSAQEQEMFARAFGRPQQAHVEPSAWRSEFHQQSAAAPQVQAQPQALSRLHAQGFSNVGSMMGMARPTSFAPQQVAPGMQDVQMDRAREEQSGKVDWEKAFVAQEATPASQLITDTLPSSTTFAGIAETRPITPPLRAHTPIADTQARDALAETAANLLSTVKSAEEQRLRTQKDEHDVGDKFAQSSFMELMRRLKDGEVAVEGDKVVEQVHPVAAADKGKGRARDDGWATDFAATMREPLEREEEGRVGEAPPILRPGQSVAEHAHEQHKWASGFDFKGFRDNAAERDRELVQSTMEGYDELDELWKAEDRTRAERERAAKGKGKERAPFQFQGDGGSFAHEEEMRDIVADTHVPLAQSSWEEDFDDPSMIVGGHQLGGGVARRLSGAGMSAQQKEWDLLQSEWDNIEVSAAGLKPKNQEEAMAASTSATSHGYAFAQKNPYVGAHYHSSATHHHAQHQANGTDLAAVLSERHDSLLQREADVQHEPTNASSWLSLGLKQQQNEREELAIAALRRAIELDPLVSNGAAHLALAVSYTNEGRRGESYEETDRWVSAQMGENRAYANEIEQYRNLFGATLPDNMVERHAYLSNLLIRLAQHRAEKGEGAAGVDADVQIALGVLFNSSEEYDKAGDCFEAALSVRPDDPLLYNRIGATYANSGKTDLAMQYYHAALDLDPGYVRARFNLAVASMNLGQYEDAVHHLLTALSVQEADMEYDNMQQTPPVNAAGVSHALWDSLHVSLIQMHKSELAPLCSARDLRGLLQAFASDR